ncbi:hypothetical protein [Lysinibacillus sp. 3P01SB]
MMTNNQINEREQLEMLTIEQLIPNDHLVRKLDAAMNLKKLTTWTWQVS